MRQGLLKLSMPRASHRPGPGSGVHITRGHGLPGLLRNSLGVWKEYPTTSRFNTSRPVCFLNLSYQFLLPCFPHHLFTIHNSTSVVPLLTHTLPHHVPVWPLFLFIWSGRYGKLNVLCNKSGKASTLATKRGSRDREKRRTLSEMTHMQIDSTVKLVCIDIRGCCRDGATPFERHWVRPFRDRGHRSGRRFLSLFHPRHSRSIGSTKISPSPHFHLVFHTRMRHLMVGICIHHDVIIAVPGRLGLFEVCVRWRYQ
jgi:hypothetical protein